MSDAEFFSIARVALPVNLPKVNINNASKFKKKKLKKQTLFPFILE